MFCNHFFFFFFFFLSRYGIIWERGYQITGPVTGTVTTKVKGSYFYNGSNSNYAPSCDGVLDYMRTFDPGDFVIPPEVSVLHVCLFQEV